MTVFLLRDRTVTEFIKLSYWLVKIILILPFQQHLPDATAPPSVLTYSLYTPHNMPHMNDLHVKDILYIPAKDCPF